MAPLFPQHPLVFERNLYDKGTEGGDLTVLEEVGQGATARVFRARLRFHGIERVVALKLFGVPESGGEVPTSPSWLQEATLLATIHHGNVPSLIRAGVLPTGAPYFLLEWVEGRTLRAIRRARLGPEPSPGDPALPDRVAVHVVCELLRTLGAIESSCGRMIHSDINPTNVMVSSAGQVMLFDFGSAYARESVRSGPGSVARGKPGYIAPEYFLGPRVDGRADQFSLGVVLFELLAGVRPCSGHASSLRGGAPSDYDSGRHEVERMLARGGRSIRDVRPQIDEPLAVAVERMLAFRPADRFACVDDALRALAPHGAGELGALRLRSAVAAITGA